MNSLKLRAVTLLLYAFCLASCNNAPPPREEAYPVANLADIQPAGEEPAELSPEPQPLLPEASAGTEDSPLPDQGPPREVSAGTGEQPSPPAPAAGQELPVVAEPPFPEPAESFFPAQPADEQISQDADLLPEPPAPAPPLAQPAQPPPPAQPAPPPPQPAPPVQSQQPSPPPSPPPVPPFVRPSGAVPPAEKEPERPETAIPVLPARPAQTGGEIQFSRTVTAYTGQYIEVPFRGLGWVYLGELGSRRGVYYDSRRIDNEGMVFVFRADEEGTYSLRFNRQDFIRDSILNDYVKVNVESAPETTGSVWRTTAVVPDRVFAGPRWPPAGMSALPAREPPVSSQTPAQPEQAPPGAAQANTAPAQPSAAQSPSAPGQPAPAQPSAAQPAGTAQAAFAGQAKQPETTAAPTGPPSSPAMYITRAKEAYDAGRIDSALEVLDQFKETYPNGSDEAYWLYGQALEANSPARDIALALDYYRRLVREYPLSTRYDAAARRIAYLERFYFNIR